MKSLGATARRILGRRPTRMIVLPISGPDPKRHTVLFFRNFRRFQGGHLNVWHYYNHVLASGTHLPYVSFVSGSSWDRSNPWTQAGLEAVPEQDVDITPDLYFLGGRDWQQLEAHSRVDSEIPVINLIQNVRHADPKHDLNAHLGNHAIRICVDAAVERAIVETGRVRGPTFTIQSGTDLACGDPRTQGERDIDLLILGVKRPDMAKAIASSVAQTISNVKLITSLIPRSELLEYFGRSKISLFLPNATEGAHLPPLEGMALGTLVICPDHEGTSHCVDGTNCFRPLYNEDEIVKTVERARALTSEERRQMLDAGCRTANELSLSAERAKFLDILSRANELWQS